MLLPTIFGEDLFDGFFDDFKRPAKARRTYHTPVAGVMKTDIKEHEGNFELSIDLPGYKKDDLKIALKDGYLTVGAEQKSEDSEKDSKGKYIRRERYYGSCSRSFYVGDQVTEEDVKAKFEDGILKITVPKKEEEAAEPEEDKYIKIEG